MRCLAFAVVQALIRARGSSGAQYVARYLMMTLERSVVRSVARSVPNEYARAGSRSMVIKLRRELSAAGVRGRRELSPPMFVAVARQSRISAEIIFFQRKEGGAVRKGGAGLRVELSLRHSGEKTEY